MQTYEWTTSAPEVYVLRQRTASALLNAEHADALEHLQAPGDPDRPPTEGSPEAFGHSPTPSRRHRLFRGPAVTG